MQGNTGLSGGNTGVLEAGLSDPHHQPEEDLLGTDFLFFLAFAGKSDCVSCQFAQECQCIVSLCVSVSCVCASPNTRAKIILFSMCC